MATNLDNIVGHLRAAGLRVVETPGWITRGYANQDFQQIRGVLWHHTATHRSRFVNDNAPTLSMCINGRHDLPGPLCNIVFGRDGTVYMVATGVANHAGVGSAKGIPTNMGNHYLIGIEMESSGIAPWDWTAEQLRLAPVLGAVLERVYLQGFPEADRLQLAHYEYSSEGKIDPAGWPGGMDGLRNSINAILAGGPAPKPAPAPAPKPVPTPVSPSNGLVNRTVTNPVAWVRTAPSATAPKAPGYSGGIAKGGIIAVQGYVKGQDPFGTRDDAWYKTRSGFYVWANAAQNDINGLRYLGDMSGAVARPAPAPAPKALYVTLPATASRWGVYRLGVAPVVANISGYLAPSQFGGLTYHIESWAIPNVVAIINTKTFGRVQIYVAPDSGAKVFAK